MEDLTNSGSTNEHIDVRVLIHSGVLIFFGYFLTSSGHLAWAYHLSDFVSSSVCNVITMVAGYSCQAFGIACFAWFYRHYPASCHLFALSSIILYSLCMVPAVMSRSLYGTAVFGLLMSTLCGCIAGYYLLNLAVKTLARFRARVFGLSYTLVILASWVLSLAGGAAFLKSGKALLVYMAVAAGFFLCLIAIKRQESTHSPVNTETGSWQQISSVHMHSGCGQLIAPGKQLSSGNTFLLLCISIFLISLVKDISSSFYSADITAGVSLEFSRIFYGLGLVIAGIISDHSRKYGAVCTLSGLILPFVILALSGEPIPTILLWSLDYFVFSFFTIYRIIVFSDAAQAGDTPWISGYGLLLGRLGDAAGTGISSFFSPRPVLLIICASILFVITTVLFLQVYQALYVPSIAKQRTEREKFDHFAVRHDLSVREQDVLRLLLAQRTTKEMADDLIVSESTVKFHVHNILKKTGCKTRLEVASKFIEDQD